MILLFQLIFKPIYYRLVKREQYSKCKCDIFCTTCICKYMSISLCFLLFYLHLFLISCIVFYFVFLFLASLSSFSPFSLPSLSSLSLFSLLSLPSFLFFLFLFRCTKWSYIQIREVHKRRYLLRHCAMEVFSNDGQSLFMIFHLSQRDRIYQKLVVY